MYHLDLTFSVVWVRPLASSEDETSTLGLWGMWSNPSLTLLGFVVPVRVPSVDII